MVRVTNSPKSIAKGYVTIGEWGEAGWKAEKCLGGHNEVKTRWHYLSHLSIKICKQLPLGEGLLRSKYIIII